MPKQMSPRSIFLTVVIMVVLIFLYWIVNPAGKAPGVYVSVSGDSLELLRLGKSPGEPFCAMCFDKYKVKLEILHQDGNKTACERANLMKGNNFVYCELGEEGSKSVKGELFEVIDNIEYKLDEKEGEFIWEN